MSYQTIKHVQDIAVVTVIVGLLLVVGGCLRLIGELLAERAACYQTASQVGGTCQLEQDAPFEYHYYMTPPQTPAETHVESLQWHSNNTNSNTYYLTTKHTTQSL